MTDTRPWALVLGDGKPGHENQSLGVLPEGLEPWCFRPAFRSRPAWLRAWIASRLPVPLGGVAGRFPWGGVIGNAAELAARLEQVPLPELVVSSGSGPAPLTLLLARRLGRPAVTCMRPSTGLVRFDLVFVPRHDRYRSTPRAVTTLGAPNRIDAAALRAEGERLKAARHLKGERFVSLLLGGDAARHRLPADLAERIFDGGLRLAREGGAELLVTTSRRTRPEAEARLAARSGEAAYFCSGRTDPGNPVPGMLGLSDLVVVTEDSVSMISEAASAPCRVLTVAVERTGRRSRHDDVLEALAAEGYVRRTTAGRLAEDGADLLRAAPPPVLDDSRRCREAVAELVGAACGR